MINMTFVEKETEEYLSSVLSAFSPGIQYACAYGSGVFKQQGHKSMNDNMIDFIFVVDDAFLWHSQTLLKYPGHYSFMRHLGPKQIAACQNSYGAGVYFNTCVEFNGRLIKYGVVDTQTFVKDMTEWKDLYIAGRLQKPVLTLKGLDSPDISSTFTVNLRSAVLTSLFLLPEECTLEEFFTKIASLSYTGDPRMVIGEDKGKVKNIVVPNLEKFIDLYKPVLSKMSSISLQNSTLVQDVNPEVLYNNFRMLPLNLSNSVCRNLQLTKQKEEFLKKRFMALHSNQLNDAIASCVAQIVRRSSTTQTIKNSATAGIRKSLFYSGEKLKKMFRGLKR